jgi:hypothetical protein
MTRAGHHANVLYDFEPSFDTAPSSPDPLVFGGNVTMDTFEGSHEAVRIFNADRKAANIIEQIFDGAWSITGELAPEPPWWLSTVLGSPNSTNVAGSLYDHEYGLGVGGDPDSLRLYQPTEGFSEYKELPGCVVATLTIDQSVPGNAEFTLSGAYAREPEENTTLTIDVDDFSDRTFNNRLAELTVGGDTQGLVQSASVTIETGTEIINELGTGHGVDFSPKVLAPSVDFEKIIDTSQTTDTTNLYDRFTSKNQVDVVLSYDNGESGDAQYRLEFTVGASFPDSWSRTGVNDPEADLSDDLNEMAEDFDAVITVDESSPP